MHIDAHQEAESLGCVCSAVGPQQVPGSGHAENEPCRLVRAVAGFWGRRCCARHRELPQEPWQGATPASCLASSVKLCSHHHQPDTSPFSAKRWSLCPTPGTPVSPGESAGLTAVAWSVDQPERPHWCSYAGTRTSSAACMVVKALTGPPRAQVCAAGARVRVKLDEARIEELLRGSDSNASSAAARVLSCLGDMGQVSFMPHAGGEPSRGCAAATHDLAPASRCLHPHETDRAFSVR